MFFEIGVLKVAGKANHFQRAIRLNVSNTWIGCSEFGHLILI